MPASVYCLVFKDPKMKKLAPCRLQIGTYTADTLKIIGSCTFYVLHPDSEKLIQITFYVAINDGSVLLSCRTILALHLIQTRSQLDYIPPRASLITSTMDHPKETRPVPLTVHSSKQEASAEMKDMKVQATKPVFTLVSKKPGMNKLVKSKEQILTSYPVVLEAVGRFPGSPYHIQVDPAITPNQIPCTPVSVHLKEAFKK